MKPQKPFISIVIPSLNEEKYLPRLLDNLARQTSQNFEVIHVDGYSEDKTCTLARRFANKLPAYTQLHSKIRHVSTQRNLGAKHAKGKYLAFIDADGQIPPYFIEGISYHLHRRPTDVFTVWFRPDSERPADKTFITAINLSQEISLSLDAPFGMGVFIGCRRRAFKRIGGFREDVSFGEDEDFMKTAHRLGLDVSIYREPRLVMSLRRFRHEGSLTSLQQIAAKRLNAITSDSRRLFKPKDYLMGGHIFTEETRDSSMFSRLDSAIRQFTRRPKLKQFLRNLLTFQEVDDPTS